jgi:hypothetical protein
MPSMQRKQRCWVAHQSKFRNIYATEARRKTQ